MKSSQQPALCLFITGLIGLGVLALIVGDFAMVWQPVPAWVPARTAIAYACGVLMLLIAAGLFVPRSRAIAVRILLPYLLLWAFLKVPDVVLNPKIEASYLGLGELTLLLAGGWTLFARLSGVTRPGWLTDDLGVRCAQILFALSIIPIGLSHIVYVDATAGYVPHWLPYPREWAYLTGAGQIASGLGVLFNVLPRIAAWAEAWQIALYTLLVWLPPLIVGHRTRLNFTAFFISWIIGAAAWAVAQNVAAKGSDASLK